MSFGFPPMQLSGYNEHMERLKFYSSNHEQWFKSLLESIVAYYGGRLIALVIYGSYARFENKLDSDLDLLLVLEGMEGVGRLRRQDEFVSQVELPLEDLARKVAGERIVTEISSMILSPLEADRFLPIYLDMVDHHLLLSDREGFMEKILERTRAMMKKWGSRKRQIGNHWYWEIRPGLKWGETFDYDQ